MILSAVLIAVVCADKIRTLDYGTWMGTRSLQRSTITFYNIPYAAPPLGPLRFRPPQPPLNVSLLGILDATQSGPACMVNQKDIINAFAKTSEDCLGLNVIIPARRAKPGANLPVFVCKCKLTRRCIRGEIHRWLRHLSLRSWIQKYH